MFYCSKANTRSCVLQADPPRSLPPLTSLKVENQKDFDFLPILTAATRLSTLTMFGECDVTAALPLAVDRLPSLRRIISSRKSHGTKDVYAFGQIEKILRQRGGALVFGSDG